MKILIIAKFSLFLICTFFIANSLLFAIGIAYYEMLTPKRCWDYFQLVFGLAALIYFIKYPPNLAEHPVDMVLYGLLLLYYCAIFYFPVKLWWRKRTVFHAWLVAMVGVLQPPYIYFCLYKGPWYIYNGIFVMTAIYAIAGLFVRYFLRRRARVAVTDSS